MLVGEALADAGCVALLAFNWYDSTNTDAERRAMLLVGEAEADAAMRRLKMGKTELKRVQQHKRLLAQLPDPNVPGPPPNLLALLVQKYKSRQS